MPNAPFQTQLRGIFLDMDGVVVDSEPILRDAVSQLFAEKGVKVRPTDGQAFLGTGEDHVPEGVAAEHGATLNLARDRDPGVILYLLGQKGLSAVDVNAVVNHKAGLLGVSGITSDMKDLLGKENEDPHAAEAIELFCYQAKKFLASLTAVLGGLDTLIFTGGIGENAPSIRWRICEDLGFMGIHVECARNDLNAPMISADGSLATVRVMRTNEDLMIARHTAPLLCNAT